MGETGRGALFFWMVGVTGGAGTSGGKSSLEVSRDRRSRGRDWSGGTRDWPGGPSDWPGGARDWLGGARVTPREIALKSGARFHDGAVPVFLAHGAEEGRAVGVFPSFGAVLRGVGGGTDTTLLWSCTCFRVMPVGHTRGATKGAMNCPFRVVFTEVTEINFFGRGPGVFDFNSFGRCFRVEVMSFGNEDIWVLPLQCCR